MTTYMPRDLARDLGYTDEARPGLVVREYLRKRYPEHPKHQRWVLDGEQADVRAGERAVRGRGTFRVAVDHCRDFRLLT